MKISLLTTLLVAFLLLFTNGIRSQTTQTKLNQVELMKQFIGTWKSETNDTTYIIEDKHYGDGHEVYMKNETKGKIIWEAKSLVGYDKKNDMLIETIIENDSPNITLFSMRFISPNKFEEILLEDLPNPEKAIEKWTYELTSPDIHIATYIKNNKVVSVNTFKRVK